MKTLSPAKPARPDARTWKQLWETAGPLLSAFDLDVLLSEISQSAAEAAGAEAASLLLLTGEGRSLSFRTATGDQGRVLRKHSFPADRGLAGWVARNGKPLIVNDVSTDDRFDARMDETTGFRTRSILAVPLWNGTELLGVCEAINKQGGGDFSSEDQDSLRSLADLASAIIVRERRAEEHRNFFSHAVEILTSAIEATRPDQRGRPARVAKTACAIGRRLGMEGNAYRDLYYGALLHDVGLIVGSAEGAHSTAGAALFRDVQLMRGVEPLIRHHQEWWDGTGHPDGLRGEDIPLGARIISLAREVELDRESGPDTARAGSGSRFDPRVVAAYLDEGHENVHKTDTWA